MQKAVKNSLSYLFIAGTAEVEVELKNAPRKDLKTVLTDMAEMEALDEVFNRSIYHWTQ